MPELKTSTCNKLPLHLHQLEIHVTWNEFLNILTAVEEKAKRDPPYYGPSLRLRRLLKSERKRIETERMWRAIKSEGVTRGEAQIEVNHNQAR
jgi:hypothetical protein